MKTRHALTALGALLLIPVGLFGIVLLIPVALLLAALPIVATAALGPILSYQRSSCSDAGTPDRRCAHGPVVRRSKMLRAARRGNPAIHRHIRQPTALVEQFTDVAPPSRADCRAPTYTMPMVLSNTAEQSLDRATGEASASNRGLER